MGIDTINPLPYCCQTRTITSSPHERLQHSSNTSCCRSRGSDGAEAGRETRFHLSHGMQEGSSFSAKQKRYPTHKETVCNLSKSEMG